jgi:hypothetical protein
MADGTISSAVEPERCQASPRSCDKVSSCIQSPGNSASPMYCWLRFPGPHSQPIGAPARASDPRCGLASQADTAKVRSRNRSRRDRHPPRSANSTTIAVARPSTPPSRDRAWTPADCVLRSAPTLGWRQHTRNPLIAACPLCPSQALLAVRRHS